MIKKLNIKNNIEYNIILEYVNYNDFILSRVNNFIYTGYINNKLFNLNRISILVNYYYFIINKYKNIKNIFYYDSIVIINLFKIKPNIMLLKNHKCKINSTPGIIVNKLAIKEKKNKRDFKIINIMIKLFFYYTIHLHQNKRFFIHIRGLDLKLGKVLTLLNDFINVKKSCIMITPKIAFFKKKFKKIKSIKKKFKKKNLKKINKK